MGGLLMSDHKLSASISGQSGVRSGGQVVSLNMQEAMDLLSVSRPTFYRWVRAGKVPGRKVGRQWRFQRSDIEQFMRGEPPRIELTADMTPLLAMLRERLRELGCPAAESAGDLPEVQAVNLLIRLAQVMRGSDLHLAVYRQKEASELHGTCRIRIDGHLHTVAGYDARLHSALVRLIKRMAGLNERFNDCPQDGRCLVSVGGVDLDLRIAVMPALFGEAVTVRLFDSRVARVELSQFGLTGEQLQAFFRELELPGGLMLIAGPSGSGKTTTMYACLSHLAAPGRKVISIEDPVEYALPDVVQTAVNADAGLTFSRALRAAVRADANVVMVGHLPDGETLQLMLQMAATGERILTTLHASRASEALRRLVDMGGESFLIAQATTMVIGQRLARKLCADCAREESPDSRLLTRARLLWESSGQDWNRLPKKFKAPSGCAKCQFTGYRGRLILVEMLKIGPEIMAALEQNASADELQAAAVRQGMRTLAANGVDRAAAGETSLLEVFSVLSVH